MAFDKIKYDQNYKKENYYRPCVFVPKNKKDLIIGLAQERNVSVSRLFIEAAEEYYCISLDTDKN